MLSYFLLLDQEFRNESRHSQACVLYCARMIMSSIYRLLATTWDLNRLSSFVIPFWDFVAGVLKGEYLKYIRTQDFTNAKSIRDELNTLVSKLLKSLHLITQ